MNAEMAIDIFKTVVIFALYVLSPFLILTLVIGLIASIIQSVTSIQEQTLTFAPKLLGLGAMLLILAPWLLRTLTEYASTMIMRMSQLGH